MEENPYKAPASFENPRGRRHRLYAVRFVWGILTIVSFFWVVNVPDPRAGLAWFVFMVVPGGIAAYYLKRMERRRKEDPA
jgi:hypothetical protein